MKVKKLIKILKAMNPDAKITIKFIDKHFKTHIITKLEVYRLGESCSIDFDYFNSYYGELSVKQLIESLQESRINPNSKIVIRRMDGWEGCIWDEFNHFHIYEKDNAVIIHKFDYISTRSEMKTIKQKEEAERMEETKRIQAERDKGHMSVLREKLKQKKVVANEISDP